MTELPKTFPGKNHYYKNYDDLPRFISYYHQIDMIRKINPKTVLEIGIGNKAVSNYLRFQEGIDVTTCDHDEVLQPDCVSDIRSLPFKSNSFDAVLVCEILEHLPWEDLRQSLIQVANATRRYVVTSLPVISMYFECVVKFPMLNPIFNRLFLDFFVQVPFFTFDKCPPGHYWEIGARGYPISRVRKRFREVFRILMEKRPVLNPKHRFFLLEKK